MGYTPWDTYINTMPIPLTVEELQQALPIKYNTDWKTIAETITSYGGDPTNFDELASLCGLSSTTSVDGTSTVWYYGDKVDIATKSIVPSVSTGSTNTRTAVRTPINTTVDDVTGKVTASALPKTGSFAQNAVYVLGELGQANTAASVGIWLGKTIDSTLYNLAPDYWDSIGLSSLNPETWNSITVGDDSLGANLFNWVFGIDPDTGNMQAYADADAVAYMAYALNQNGLIHTSYEYDYDDTSQLSGYAAGAYTLPFGINISNGVGYLGNSANRYFRFEASQNTSDVYYFTLLMHNSTTGILVSCSKNPYVSTRYSVSTGQPLGQYNGLKRTLYGIDFYVYAYSETPIYNPIPSPPYSLMSDYSYVSAANEMSFVLLYGDAQSIIQGIGDQPNATLPDTSTWADIPSTDNYLRSAYPDSYSNALQYDVLQPDGSVVTKTYIPIPMPQNTTSPESSTDSEPWNNPQPTSDGATQNNTSMNVDNLPEEFIKELIKIITQIVTLPKTDIDNPTTTGNGDGPTLTPIAGSASALWSVYHPTKSQIDSFGAWLWTDNVIQQFIQLLNNPMEGIITLHKVFAPPIDSGTATIVVGRLDSEVPSATVNQQYVSVDCGSIDIDEYFGNIFDYPPYTTISLYLPFIGFVPLNPDDVMRSTVSISYGVDIFTGACLAMVDVSRDGNNVGMYQYSGVASVEYPLTGAQHSGLISGLLGVAGGIAGVALASTGVGAVAGAGSIAGGLANLAKSNPARSGGFSGNAGAMGIKIPYIIIERPITKIAGNFDILNGYPTNYNIRLGDCSGNVIVKYVHVDGISATEQELSMIESMLKSGVVV